MTVRLVLRDGREARADPAVHGRTVESMVASVTDSSLTGSAVPLAEALIQTDLGPVPYSDINTFAEDTDFER